MQRVTLMVVAAMVLAGCAAPDAATGPGDETFDDVDVQVTSNTGAILGVVVDDTITPVAGALVSLTTSGGSLEKITDAQGRFTFDNLEAGPYFLKISKDLYESVQMSTTVVAGIEKPPTLNAMIPRLYQIDPYMNSIKQTGFFQCSQHGMAYYSSSPCTSVAPQTNEFTDPVTNQYQEREWHADVPAGWLTQVFEMTWNPSAYGTAPGMGIVVSSYKPERSGSHSFANYGSANPMRFQLNLGEDGPGATAGGGPMGAQIPAEGMDDMSFFTSVRGTDPFPMDRGVAVDQKFEVHINQFIACVAPEGWSMVAGDDDPC